MERYYKALHRTPDGKLISPVAHPSWAVEYKPGEWVQAPVGGLFLSPTEKYARHIAETCAESPAEVWECEAQDPINKPWVALPFDPIGMTSVWLSDEYTPGPRMPKHPDICAPAKLFRQVRLVRRIA
jgi:hypothetical protein